MKTIGQREKGVTFTGWLIILALIGFFVLLGLKVVPIYLENYTVKDIVQSLKEEPLITKKSARDVKKMIVHRIDINGIYDLPSEKVIVKKRPGVMRVSIDYTVQKNMFGNLDILVTFSEKVELISN